MGNRKFAFLNSFCLSDGFAKKLWYGNFDLMIVQTIGLSFGVLSFCPVMLLPRMPLCQSIEKATFTYSRHCPTASEGKVL